MPEIKQLLTSRLGLFPLNTELKQGLMKEDDTEQNLIVAEQKEKRGGHIT